ncbi:MAG: DUF4440 domain-containing protein, partial [Burkholderiales bacterium]|nr:DUF4440 domain-containing protein [Burkholderiales bacterium]
VRIHQGAVIAVHNLIEQVVVSGRGGTRVVECAATNVYLKTVEGWRIVLHHACEVGEGGPAPESSNGSTVLH